MFLQRSSPWPLAGFSFLAASLILFALSAAQGFPAIGPGFHTSVAVTVTINVLATALFYRALSRIDLSLGLPMLAFTPVFLILTSFLILGEVPTFSGALGILLVTAGAYLLHLEYHQGRPISFTAPLGILQQSRGVQMMLLVAFLYSLSVNYDKRVVLTSDPVFGSAVVLFLLALPFLIVTAFSRPKVPDGPLPRPIFRETALSYPVVWVYIGTGFVLALEAVAVNIGYTLTVVPYVIAVKRLSIFFSVLYGGLLLGEHQLGGRALGGMVMIAGTVLIGLLG